MFGNLRKPEDFNWNLHRLGNLKCHKRGKLHCNCERTYFSKCVFLQIMFDPLISTFHMSNENGYNSKYRRCIKPRYPSVKHHCFIYNSLWAIFKYGLMLNISSLISGLLLHVFVHL
jgi:hypothetical protein